MARSGVRSARRPRNSRPGPWASTRTARSRTRRAAGSTRWARTSSWWAARPDATAFPPAAAWLVREALHLVDRAPQLVREGADLRGGEDGGQRLVVPEGALTAP